MERNSFAYFCYLKTIRAAKDPGCHPHAFATRVGYGETSAGGQELLQKRYALACGCYLNDRMKHG
jgi:hypothetical protein